MKKTLIGWLLDNKDVAYPGIYKPEGDGWIPCIITYSEDEWEDVEVVRYGKMSEGAWFGSTFKKEQAEAWAKQHKGEIVELRGTYRRRKPEPEVETYLVCETYNANGYRIGQIQVPETLIGKRVRVEVVE